jgi:hypothetical protein
MCDADRKGRADDGKHAITSSSSTQPRRLRGPLSLLHPAPSSTALCNLLTFSLLPCRSKHSGAFLQ